jgi:hypothetical protein
MAASSNAAMVQVFILLLFTAGQAFWMLGQGSQLHGRGERHEGGTADSFGSDELERNDHLVHAYYFLFKQLV